MRTEKLPRSHFFDDIVKCFRNRSSLAFRHVDSTISFHVSVCCRIRFNMCSIFSVSTSSVCPISSNTCVSRSSFLVSLSCCFISLNIHFLRERVKTFRYDISQNVTYSRGMTVFHLQPVHWSTTQTMLRWSKLSSGNFIQNRSRMGLS